MNDEKTNSSRPRLGVVPDIQAPINGRSTVAKWVLTLSEPLVSTSQRIAIDKEMAAFVKKSPHWAANWFAGVLTDIMSTLPPADPWRRLSGTVDLAAIYDDAKESAEQGRVTFQNREGAKPLATTGAVLPDGSPFGTYTNATDLVMSELGEPVHDEKLIAVALGMDPLAAAILALAGSNVEALAATLDKIYHRLWTAEFSGHSNVDPGAAFLEAAGSALQWAIHRRRAYTGNDDPFPSILGFAWMARADRVTNGGRNIASELGLARDAKIDPSAYDDLKAF
jgi:hypothetical protein